MTLSTHVLDTTQGRPAADMAILLFARGQLLLEGRTNADGRCPATLALGLGRGCYTLRFGVADYFRALGLVLPEPPFLDWVSIDFGIADPGAHHHVPLLVSPFAYSTYRGS